MEKTREVQQRCFDGTALRCNTDMGATEIRQYCQVDEAGRSLLKEAIEYEP